MKNEPYMLLDFVLIIDMLLATFRAEKNLFKTKSPDMSPNLAHVGCLRSLGTQQTPELQQFAIAWSGFTRGMTTANKGNN